MFYSVVTAPDFYVVANSGIATSHPPHQVIDWTPGDCYVVMVFRTPFEAKTEHGREMGHAGQMFITSPGRYEWHRGIDGEGFCNDWVHLIADPVRELIGASGLPLNRIFSVSDPEDVRRVIADITHERLLNAPRHSEMLACKAVELILLTSRFFEMAQRKAESPVEHGHYERFCALRRQLKETAVTSWTVADMAATVHLSPNRFAVLYKKFFLVSPIDDLIDMRLDEAKRLLRQGRMTVSEIAERCGFNNLNYFSRIFKARTGSSPRQHRS